MNLSASSTDPDDARLAALVPRASQGDRGAAAELLRGVQDRLYRFALSQLRDPEAAADATQETALRVLESLDRYNGQCRVMTWVFGYALNVCREQRRRQSRWTTESPDLVESFEHEAPCSAWRVELEETLQQTHKAIDQLPPRQREALALRYFEHLSVRETAQAMKCSEGTVKAAVWQALRRLRHEMGASLGTDL